MVHVFGRSLASKIPIQKPVLITVALKDTSTEMYKAAEKFILDNKIW